MMQCIIEEHRFSIVESPDILCMYLKPSYFCGHIVVWLLLNISLSIDGFCGREERNVGSVYWCGQYEGW
uniref:Peptidyl-prolyl cis-trans isomerase FKBP42 isoform X2 n=1 Tax=Rhizophora mucronata TaxID=61149 RepID=A0A2P2KL81_RHIMU